MLYNRIKIRFLLYPLSALLFLCMQSSCIEEDNLDTDQQIAGVQIKAASFNIRFDNPDDGYTSWDNRRKGVVKFLDVEDPDILGLQEVLKNQLDYIDLRLSDHDYVGIGRDDGKAAGEFAPVFYKRERFQLIDSGTFWLSETPDKPSMGWDALINRICTYAFLKDQKTGKDIHFYNTHYSHVGDIARRESAGLILHYIDSLSQNVRVILTGDFNAEPDSEPYQEITKYGLKDSYYADVTFGPEGTYNGFDIFDSHDRRIDYIFFRGYHPEKYYTSNVLINNNFLSDHFPVFSVLEYRTWNNDLDLLYKAKTQILPTT